MKTSLFARKDTYEKVARSLAEGDGDGRLPWNKDGPLGEADPDNTESILISWLCTEGNYVRYRGKDNKFLGNSRKLEFDVNVLPNRFRARLST